MSDSTHHAVRGCTRRRTEGRGGAAKRWVLYSVTARTGIRYTHSGDILRRPHKLTATVTLPSDPEAGIFIESQHGPEIADEELVLCGRGAIYTRPLYRPVIDDTNK